MCDADYPVETERTRWVEVAEPLSGNRGDISRYGAGFGSCLCALNGQHVGRTRASVQLRPKGPRWLFAVRRPVV